jgi:deazaflavin-dependent oxidoreductase (nitroreductase family)
VSPYRILFRSALQVQEWLYVRSDGLVGHRLLGVPCLLLRTTGRRSGQIRTNSLTYARDGNRWIVVPSKGGDPKPPAWLLNLEAHPRVEVQVGRTRHICSATVIGHDDPDFPRLWKLVNDGNRGRYDAYQRKTERPIPVVALAPEV